ncbi:hypothetical protein GYMLUDRAFT_252670 [Collybiopsis luxurians FD-317 M1]|uniref:DUF6533 domain-containing protein n=1 Tax=Collybiopsis luxurians FD-317 M1 TaxID=944289 RepID=A0A0D0AKM1_9AGAR|nr:hypothetical protein GYMLUDRAFT_252670 [Collybiopsis luxurians FD-317 M1]
MARSQFVSAYSPLNAATAKSDYVLTFPMEVQYLWTSKFRLSTFLYVLCRYALLANVLYLLDIAGKLTENCNTWYQFISALSVLGRAAVIVVFTGRTWAVWGKNRFILAYMSLLGVTCVALDITHVPGLRCAGSSTIPMSAARSSLHSPNDLLSILMVVFEFSSAILNSIRCVLAFRAQGRSWKEQREGFQFLLFEQGIFYFSIISLFTTAAVILNFQAPSGFFQRLLNALTLPLSGLLTARLLLHIREWEYKHSPAGINDQGDQPEHATLSLSFRGAAATVSTMLYSDFGSDPVARGTLPDSRSEEHGDQESSTEIGHHLDLETGSSSDNDHPNSPVQFNHTVKEGKKPAHEEN